MAIGLTPGEEYEYVLAEDRSKDDDDPTRTVFQLRTLTSREATKLEDFAGNYDPNAGDVRMTFGTNSMLALQAGLCGWRNYLDGDGNAIPFVSTGKQLNILGKNVDPPTDATLGRLTAAHRQELAEAIREGNRLTKEEKKT